MRGILDLNLSFVLFAVVEILNLILLNLGIDLRREKMDPRFGREEELFRSIEEEEENPLKIEAAYSYNDLVWRESKA